jgi:methylglutaconyl-CoA hydratase
MFVKYEAANRVGYITLDRPDKSNALSYQVVQELKETFSYAEKDNSVKVIVLQANGDSFCAGADLAYLQKLQQFSYAENLSDSDHLRGLYYQIYTLKKVVIGSIQGHALAGGCGLATVCDFAFSVPDAKFGYTEVKIGFIPAIVMIFLIRKVGEGNAKKLLLTGDLVTAYDALQFGIVNRVVPREQLSVEVTNFAQKLVAANSGHSMMLIKRMIAQVQSLSLESALSYAAEMNAKERSSEDCKKGIAAFLNKEKMEW